MEEVMILYGMYQVMIIYFYRFIFFIKYYNFLLHNIMYYSDYIISYLIYIYYNLNSEATDILNKYGGFDDLMIYK